MQELRGKVAVVTGAASGIGLALAERFVAEGMKVVLADVESGPLADATNRLREAGGDVTGFVADVSDPGAVDRLADVSYDAFGAVHVLCNNAGVISGGASWEIPLQDWDWVLGVNLYGVIHGLRSFLPRMQAQDTWGHVVNTASMAGVTALPFVSVYHVSKHSVVALSECLYKELQASQSKIGVSILCPEMVDTAIGEAERNRPEELRSEGPAPTREMIQKSTAEAAKGGLPPSEMADRIVTALHDGRFYILADDGNWRAISNTRCEDVTLARNPTMTTPTA